MNATEYLSFLISCVEPSNEQLVEIGEGLIEIGRIRAKQMDNPLILESYKDYVMNNLKNPINRHKFIHDTLFQPVKDALPNDVQRAIKNVPVGRLPSMSPNACAVSSPSGQPVILIDQGLVTLIAYYLETKIASGVISKSDGIEVGEQYLLQSFRTILQYFLYNRALKPPIIVPLSEELMQIIQIIALAAQAFVLMHEFAHIYAGHLENAVTRSMRIIGSKGIESDFYQISQKYEVKADLLAWNWFKDYWQSIPILSHLNKLQAFMGPLYFFEMLSLIEKNNIQTSPYSTHPPAQWRLSFLVLAISEPMDSDIKEFAQEVLANAQTMPMLKFNS